MNATSTMELYLVFRTAENPSSSCSSGVLSAQAECHYTCRHGAKRTTYSCNWLPKALRFCVTEGAAPKEQKKGAAGLPSSVEADDRHWDSTARNHRAQTTEQNEHTPQTTDLQRSQRFCIYKYPSKELSTTTDLRQQTPRARGGFVHSTVCQTTQAAPKLTLGSSCRARLD